MDDPAGKAEIGGAGGSERMQPSDFFYGKQVSVMPPLSEACRASLELLVPGRDVFDEADFDAVDYINRSFGTVQSLVVMDDAIHRVKISMRRTDAELARAVQRESMLKEQSRSSLEEARRSIQDMLRRIGEIKQKADESEVMVQEICHDIRSLDLAKKNLTQAHNALQKLKMLVSSVESLREAMDGDRYQKISGYLLAIDDFSSYFAPYEHNSKIVALTSSVESIKWSLQKLMMSQFTKMAEFPSAVTDSLGHVCEVVDALGPKVRAEFMGVFCQKRLKSYQDKFQPRTQLYELEYIVQRFVWLQQELRTFDQDYSRLFPAAWRMDEKLVDEFISLTHEHLTEILDRMSQSNALTVDLLTSRLRDTLEFERKMGQRFAPAEDEANGDQGGGNGDGDDGDLNGRGDFEFSAEGGPLTAAAIQERVRRYQEKLKAKEQRATLVQFKKRNRFRGVLSERFDPYMSIYIKHINDTVTTEIAEQMRKEEWDVPDDSDSIKVLGSSRELMLTINGIMTSCAQLSRAQPLYEMYRHVIKRHLNKYAKTLLRKLPSVSDLAKVETRRFSEKELRTVLLIINSAEYCAKLVDQMAEKLRKLIDEAFREEIEVSKEKETYENLISQATKSLVAGVENRVLVPLGGMHKINWAAVEDVGDQSEYVVQVSEVLTASFAACRNWLQPLHYAFFCDSFVGTFVPKLVEYIYRCRNINDLGSQQLLLDVTSIKTLLLNVPPAQGSKVSKRYSNIVTKETGRAIALLKVVRAPPETLLETYRTLVPDGNEAGFQKVLELRGVRNRDTLSGFLQRYQQVAQKRIAKPMSFLKFGGTTSSSSAQNTTNPSN